MSDYGADENPDLNVARIVARDMNFMNTDKVNAMQWSSGNPTLDIKLANRLDHSNVHILIDPT